MKQDQSQITMRAHYFNTKVIEIIYSSYDLDGNNKHSEHKIFLSLDQSKELLRTLRDAVGFLEKHYND